MGIPREDTGLPDKKNGILDGIRSKCEEGQNLFFNVLLHAGVCAPALILAYNGYKECARGYEHVLPHSSSSYSVYANVQELPRALKDSIKRPFSWAILVFTAVFLFRVSPPKTRPANYL